MLEEDEAALAAAFAEAIVRPGGSALLLGEDNRRLTGQPWVSLPEAVGSGRAFAVEPCDHMVAVDVDDEEDAAWAAAVRAGLEPRGCHFVTVDSGRAGHQHMWVLMPPGWTYEYLKGQVEQVAGPPKTWGQVRRSATRPPYAPHRLGGRSEVVQPGLGTALGLFRSHRPQPFWMLVSDISSWLDPRIVIRKRGEIDRGRTIHRVAMMLVNARRSQADFEQLLGKGRNEVTSKYWDIDAHRRQDAVDLWWRRASEYVRDNPSRAADREVVEGLLADLPQMDWQQRTGATDRAVYRALLETGHKAGSLKVDASIRRLSELTNISTGAVSVALDRLTDQQFIARWDEPGKAHHLAGSFSLSTDVPRKTIACTDTWSFLGGPKAMCARELEILGDVFANAPGLGLSTRETWEALPTSPTTTSEVVVLLAGQRKHATVLAHLKKLHRHGLAGREGNRWWRVEPPEDELVRLALRLGVKGKRQRRRDRFERERQNYLKTFGPQARAAG